jgi:hypothetical protein
MDMSKEGILSSTELQAFGCLCVKGDVAPVWFFIELFNQRLLSYIGHDSKHGRLRSYLKIRADKSVPTVNNDSPFQKISSKRIGNPPISDTDFDLMAQMGRCHLKYPYYASRRIRDWLNRFDLEFLCVLLAGHKLRQ